MKLIDSHLFGLKNLVKIIFQENKGQALVEYALILGGIVLAVISIIFAFGESLNNLYQLIVNAL